MMLTLSLVLFTFGSVLCTELCKEKEWYDDLQVRCRRCQTCVDKSWEAAPCTAFMDTMCVDLADIAPLVKNLEASEKARNNKLLDHNKHHRWHEMEGAVKDESLLSDSIAKDMTESKNMQEYSFDQWDMIFVTILSLVFLLFVVLVIMWTVKYFGNPLQWDQNKRTRIRLFSRERLNTTEYMNNLATLDRRLAIDEILEKKKRAIFEPQLLKENIYVDDVFVDISGLPRNLRNNHDYEEVDHKKCLLEMKDQQ